MHLHIQPIQIKKIRSQILDYTWCDYENLRDIGVSENDYQMIHWDFAGGV